MEKRRFDPTGHELIAYYLRNHILRKSYPESGTIPQETLFGENISPWDKFCDPYNEYQWLESDSVPTLFLFTRLSDVGTTDKSTGIQKVRTAGCGAWHSNDSLHEVKRGGLVVGHCRVLSFRSNNGKPTVGQWTLYEYSISADAFPEVQNVEGWQNIVVCKIRRNDNKASVGGKITHKNNKKKPAAPYPNKPGRPGRSNN